MPSRKSRAHWPLYPCRLRLLGALAAALVLAPLTLVRVRWVSAGQCALTVFLVILPVSHIRFEHLVIAIDVVPLREGALAVPLVLHPRALVHGIVGIETLALSVPLTSTPHPRVLVAVCVDHLARPVGTAEPVAAALARVHVAVFVADGSLGHVPCPELARVNASRLCQCPLAIRLAVLPLPLVHLAVPRLRADAIAIALLKLSRVRGSIHHPHRAPALLFTVFELALVEDGVFSHELLPPLPKI